MSTRYVPKDENRPDILSRLSDEMGPFFIGPIPLQGFLGFFPASSGVGDHAGGRAIYSIQETEKR